MVEVSGCSTTCMHCWALGRNYRPMPIEDATFILDELSRFCGERRLGYATYPMHEVTAHPDAPDIIRLFAPHLGEDYDPILTPGTPLASREKWAQIFAAAKQCGAHALWVAFHGYGAEHDRQLNRPGAFEETCLAVRRCPALRAGHRRERVPDQASSARLRPPAGRPARPAARRAQHHPRGVYADAAEQALRGAGRNWMTCCRSPGGSWMSRCWAARSGAVSNRTPRPRECGARDGSFPETGFWTSAYLQLVCRPNLDLHTGITGIYRRRHGNLRHDGA